MRALRDWLTLLPALACAAAVGCSRSDDRPLVTLSASALGAEGRLVQQQLAAFQEQHPGVRAELRVTPDAADQRHQLYVQWLNARAPEPDVLQLDIIWTAEFAAAGWVLPLHQTAADAADFFPAALAANQWRRTLYAIPWFVDAGLLYWRTDLMAAPPATLAALRGSARDAMQSGVPYGLLWQGARYEGLVAVFVEHLAAFGGAILDAAGRVVVDQPPAVRALTFMRETVEEGIVPRSALTWQEEQVRFAFQNGQSAFMRNWPYAWPLLQERSGSRVAGRVGVAPFPAAEGGSPGAALGGGQLAINAHTRQPELARALVEFLTAPEQMLERARVAAQLPPRRSLYQSQQLADALPLPVAEALRALDRAVPRPVTPVYSELSELLQVRLHRALTGQQASGEALGDAAAEIRALLARAGLATAEQTQ